VWASSTTALSSPTIDLHEERQDAVYVRRIYVVEDTIAISPPD